jgi:sugar lactone lactonase YvrE
MSTNVITTIAGTGVSGSYDSSVTSATLANLNRPSGLAIDTSGSILYFAEYENNVIQKIILSSGALSTIVGTGSYPNDYTASPTATGSSVDIAYPYEIALDSTNNILFFAESGSHAIRKVSYSI